MKLLFDQNLSFRLCKVLTKSFPSSLHVGDVGLDSAPDSAIWKYAGEHGLLLVSHDADFADMAILKGAPPKLLWLRCGNRPTGRIAALLEEHSSAIAAFVNDADAVCYEIYE